MLIESGAWRGRLDVLAAQASKIAIAEIIGGNEDDVGLAGVGTGPSHGASDSSPHRFYYSGNRIDGTLLLNPNPNLTLNRFDGMDYD